MGMPCFHRIIAATAFLGQAVVCAMHSPALESSIPTLTRPPTSYSQGTVSTSAEAPLSGNLLVTGNVTGGKHLQSASPYTDTSRLQTPLSTTSLDSFLRQAATSYQPPQYEALYVPFYSSSGTTARTWMNQPAPLSPTQTAVGVMSQPHVGPIAPTGPLRMPAAVLPPLVAGRAPVSKFWQDTLTQVRRDYGNDIPPEVWERLAQALSVPDPDITVDTALLPPAAPLTEPERRIHEVTDARDAHESRENSADPRDEEMLAWQSLPESLTRPSFPEPNADGALPIQERLRQAFQGDLEAYHRSQCEAWTAIGEAFIKKTDYAKAVDAFTLAGQYQSEHARALAGKSFALLGLGEYTRSALLLGRILTVIPTYAEYPTILPLMLGEERVKACLRLLQEQVAEMPTAETLFLLGYLYYQLGDVVLARQSLQTVLAAGANPPGLRTLLSVVQGGS